MTCRTMGMSGRYNVRQGGDLQETLDAAFKVDDEFGVILTTLARGHKVGCCHIPDFLRRPIGDGGFIDTAGEHL